MKVTDAQKEIAASLHELSEQTRKAGYSELADIYKRMSTAFAQGDEEAALKIFLPVVQIHAKQNLPPLTGIATLFLYRLRMFYCGFKKNLAH